MAGAAGMKWIAAGLAGALLVPGAAPAGAAADAALNTFKVDQGRTGFLAQGPRPPLRLRWKFASRETRAQIESFATTDDGFSTASVHAGVVYAGGHDGWIYAIDAKSGRLLWEYKTGGHVMTTPRYRDGRVYAGSMDGHFRALNAHDGKLVWQVQFGARMWNGLRYSGMRATPLFHEGKIFLGG